MALELKGSIPAVVTPFREGEIDLAAFASLVEWQIESGSSGIVVSGTTGESATLHPGEREALCRRAIDVAKGRVPVIAGTGTNATWSSVALSKEAASWGVDALLVVTPYYNKPTQEGMVLHFKEVARGAEIPVVLYDVPGRTGVTLAEESIARLAEVPGIVAIKDATKDLARAERIARNTPLAVLSGDDASTLQLLRRGATGVVSVAANVVPGAMAQLCATLDESLDARLQPLFEALFVVSNPIPVKYALSLLGRIRNELRLPLVASSDLPGVRERLEKWR